MYPIELRESILSQNRAGVSLEDLAVEHKIQTSTLRKWGVLSALRIRQDKLPPPTCSRCGKPIASRRFARCGDCRPKIRPSPMCKVCGKTEARKGCVTCSNECAAIAIEAQHASYRKTVTKECEVCGAAMLGPPSLMRGRRSCSRECRAVLAAREAPRKLCPVCGNEFIGTGKYCSDGCLAKRYRDMSTIGCRSDSVRARRRRHAPHGRCGYQGKDKREVIERLTEMQGGKCLVCGSDGERLGNGKHGLVLDHDHRTGEPRAMLCTRCNIALGAMREDPGLILGLAEYAESWSSRCSNVCNGQLANVS